MKKTIYIVLGFAFLLMSSCVTNEKEIFSASPAERMNQALKIDFSLLTSTESGWIMEYFATSTSPGYNLIVKFQSSGQAVFAAKNEFTNDAFETDSCLFQMIGDNGPVLTFNTYNKILHVFSNPVDPKGSSDLDGSGLEGDYEFVVMKADSNQIILRGKKRYTTIVLNKIPTNVSWNQYVTDLDAMNSILFLNNAPNLTMNIGNSVYTFSNGISHVFTILKSGTNQTSFNAPFIVTHSGIRFYSEQEIDGTKFQSLVLNEDKSALVSVENSEIKLSGPTDLAAYFTGNIIVWKFVREDMSADFQSNYDAIVQSCINKYSAQDVNLLIKYNTTRKTFELALTFSTNQIANEGNLDLKMSTNGKNGLTILYKGTADLNGLAYYSDVAGLKEMAALLNSNFALSTFAMINPQVIKFVNKTNANSWFSLAKK